MALRRKRKSKTRADAIIYFTTAPNEHGKKQLCVYAECLFGGGKAGPVWSHTRNAVSRVLATLRTTCECGRYYHRHKYTEGFRVTTKS